MTHDAYDRLPKFSSLDPDTASRLASWVADTHQFDAQVRAIMPALEKIITTVEVPQETLKKHARAMQEILESPAYQRALESIRGAVRDISANLQETLDSIDWSGLRRAILPINLRDHAAELSDIDLVEFLTVEGIPLYGIPRGDIAVKLLQANDLDMRQQILVEHRGDIFDDCRAELETCDLDVVGDEVRSVRDALAAAEDGHFRPAQALATVVLDSTVTRVYPVKTDRVKMTKRARGEREQPGFVDEMSLREALVWLPVWNVHERFWVADGDTVPESYSRHASVHTISDAQYTDANCVRALMVVTTLVSYVSALEPAVA